MTTMLRHQHDCGKSPIFVAPMIGLPTGSINAPGRHLSRGEPHFREKGNSLPDFEPQQNRGLWDKLHNMKICVAFDPERRTDAL